MANRKYDLTSGSILKKLLLVAVPIMGTQLMQMAYNLVDIAYLGRVGSAAVAASSTAGFYMWLSNGFLMLGRMGAEIGVSQSMGRGDVDEARRFARGALWMAGALGTVYALLAIALRAPLIGFFGLREAEVVADARRYLLIVALAIPCTYLSAAANATFTASGNSRLPFVINSLGLVFNMILDPVLIFGLRMGVTGAAAATASAQAFVCLLALGAMKRAKHRPFEEIRIMELPDWPHIRQMLRWAVPVSLESLFYTFLSMLTTRLVAGYGAGAVAAVDVGTQIESLSWLVGGGFGSAVTAFIGQNYGARRQDRIDRCLKTSLAVMSVWGVLVSLALYFLGGPMFLVFLPDRSLLPVAVLYLRIMAFSEFFLCVEGMLSGAFRGCGQTRQPATASICANITRVLMAYALSRTPLGLAGVFWGITISTDLRVIWIGAWYFKTRRSFACGPAEVAA